jgi:hypothetical protein
LEVILGRNALGVPVIVMVDEADFGFVISSLDSHLPMS